MEITFLGHSSFRIKTKQATVLTDPYDPDMVGLKFPKIAADVVTVSHDHADHNKTDLVKDVKKVVDGPGEYEISEVSIFGYQTFHDDKKGSERGKNTIYSIEVEELRLVHLGDLGHKLEEGLVERLGDVDVLMIPVGGHYTIGASLAVEVVQAIEPKIIVPMHYNLPSLKQDTFGELSGVEDFLKDVGLAVEKESKLVIKGPILESDPRVIVLTPQNA